MTFQPSIPLASDLISVSQTDLKNNFTSLGTTFDVNHVDFNATGAGKHKFVTMPNQGSDPTTAASEVALYTKALGGLSTLYMRKESNGTVIQMSSGDPIAAASGSTFLPGGIILKWGATGVVSDNSVVSFASAFPNNCFMVDITIVDPNATSKTMNVKTGSLSVNNFAVRLSSGSLSAYYIAIGN